MRHNFFVLRKVHVVLFVSNRINQMASSVFLLLGYISLDNVFNYSV